MKQNKEVWVAKLELKQIIKESLPEELKEISQQDSRDSELGFFTGYNQYRSQFLKNLKDKFNIEI